MHVSRPLLAPFALFASAAFSLVAPSASAGQSCNVDSDCGHGFDCEVVGGTACASPACAPGTTCPTTPPCEPQVIKECVPGTCAAHSDCADGMVCYAIPSTTCVSAPTPACPPNTKCDPPPTEPADCTSTTVNRCVPRYVLPCTSDASCGDGFSCVPDPDSCACGGSGVATPSGGASSGPSVPVDAGAAPYIPGPIPPPPDCTCTPSTTNHCTAKATTCSVDSDCPSTWTCVTPNVGTSCGGAAEPLPDGGFKVVTFGCDPPPPAPKQCQPPNYGGGYYGNSGIPQATGVGVSKDGSIPPRTGGGTASDGTSGSGVAGTTGSGPTHGGTGVGGSTTSEGDNASAESGSGSSSSDNGGCQISAGRTDAAGASVLAMLGVAGLIRRRKRTRWG